MAFHPYHSFPDDPSVLKIPSLGLELTVRLPPDASDNAISIIETTNAPGFGPPLHRHPETEIFRVLSGRYLYEIDGERIEVGKGEVISVPGGTPHAFVNITDKPANQFILILPAMDARRFFSELADVFAKGHPTMDTLNAFGKPWGCEFLGPPLSVKK
jgi:quercetin dioxygenase-like cupin family protein